jgi:hypothetical protein
VEDVEDDVSGTTDEGDLGLPEDLTSVAWDTPLEAFFFSSLFAELAPLKRSVSAAKGTQVSRANCLHAGVSKSWIRSVGVGSAG